MGTCHKKVSIKEKFTSGGGEGGGTLSSLHVKIVSK